MGIDRAAKVAAAAACWVAVAGAAPAGVLEVSLAGLRSAKGLVSACLTRDPARFPRCQHDPAALRIKRTAASGAPLRFEDLPSGSYALAVLHDENQNGRLDTRLGIPREGFGFSRNPRVTFGPPRFGAAAFRIAGGAVRQDVRMRYFL